MIEFDTWLTTILTGKEAIKQRVLTRLSHKTSDIPYYSRGVDIYEFKYGDQSAALMLGLRDFMPELEISGDNTRVITYGVSIDVSDVLDLEKEGKE